MILIDANILMDIWGADPAWGVWSASELRSQSVLHDLAINAIVYAEVSVSFTSSATVDKHLAELGIEVIDIPREAAFLAGKAFQEYRKRGGQRTGVLADFFIGAHALVTGCLVLTRDVRRYTTYFPGLQLIAP